jgi:hypothetical protein
MLNILAAGLLLTVSGCVLGGGGGDVVTHTTRTSITGVTCDDTMSSGAYGAQTAETICTDKDGKVVSHSSTSSTVQSRPRLVYVPLLGALPLP